MSKNSKNIGFLGFFLFSLIIVLSACSSKDPSVLKIYVRDENNELMSGVKVVIIGDTKSEPPTIDYVDTSFTNAQGIAQYDMEEFFTTSGKSVKSGYFNVLAKFGEKQAKGKVRVKKNIVTTETVTFMP
jgi:hypothetical protein